MTRDPLATQLYTKTQELAAQAKGLAALVEKTLDAMPPESDPKTIDNMVAVQFLASGMQYPLQGLSELIHNSPELANLTPGATNAISKK